MSGRRPGKPGKQPHVEKTPFSLTSTVSSLFNHAPDTLAQIINFLPDATFVIDLEGRVIAWNRAIEEMTGVKAEDILGKGDYEYAIPFYGFRRPVMIDLVNRRDPSQESMYRYVRHEGERLVSESQIPGLKPGGAYLYNTARALYNAQGDVIGAIESIRDVTEQRLAEEARRSSERRLAEIIEFLPDPAFVIDKDGKLQLWNRAMEEMTGIKASDMLGRGDYEYSLPFYGERRPVLIDLVRETNINIEQKYLSIRRVSDGVLVSESFHPLLRGGTYLSGTARALHDASGNQVGAIECVRDITYHKRAEEELAKRERLTRDILESLPGIFYAISQDGNFIRWNRNFEDITQYNAQEIATLSPLDLFAGKDKELIRERIHEVFVKGFASAEAELVSKNGIKSFYYFTGKLIELDSAPCLIGMGMDTNQRREAERALRESEERLETILKASPDPVVVYDPEGCATYINPAFTRVFGWQADEVLGRRIPFVPKEEDAKSIEVIGNVYINGGPFTFRTKRFAKSGEVLSVVISAAGIFDHLGRVSGMVVALTDVTHTEKLEAQLHQSQKMEAIGTLAGGIAHDFNNLLGVILGYADRAQDHILRGKSADYELAHIVNAAQRAAHLVQQILAFSRRGQSIMRPISLNLEVEQAIEILGRTIPKMVAIETRLAPDLSLINCDVNQVGLVLLNLANNAADAMPEGGRLVISTKNVQLDEAYCSQHPKVNPGRYVLLEVSDTGAGMDETTLQHIFEPFYTTKEIGKGTGLGLSTVYGIVADHGGHITCQSRPGAGTTMKVYWPVFQGEAKSPGVQQEAQPEGQLRGKERILLVDDEDALREVAAEALEDMGYEVVMAASGEQALDFYRGMERSVDLIILDLGMPGMGGRRCMKKILELNPRAKVLIASGYAINGEQDKAFDEGAAGFLPKPFRVADFLTTVRSVLDNK